MPSRPLSASQADAVGARGLVVAEAWADLDGGTISDVELDGCTITGSRLGGSVLTRVTLRDCVIESCDLSALRLVDVRILDTRFVRCKALGVAWSIVVTSSVSSRPLDMERCRLDFGSFAGARLGGSRFTGCSLVEADFSGADLRGVDFTGTDLTGARFTEADLRGADLVGAAGAVLDPRSTRLDGARLSVDGAFGVLSALGIEVVAGDA